MNKIKCMRAGGTMGEFIAKAEAVFSVAILNDYDDQASRGMSRYG